MPLILSIEDDPNIQELIRYNLTHNGYDVRIASDGKEGFHCAEQLNPQLILLDIMLPGLGMTGFDLCRRLKSSKRTRNIPIIMLTAKTEESDIVTGLELGADDYLPKPFSPRVLIARIGSVLRRSAGNNFGDDGLISIHDIVIDTKKHEVRRGSQKLKLSLTEFAILDFLARRPGWVYSREKIIQGVKGRNYFVTERSIDVQMFGLRKKLGTQSEIIETVRGIGYRIRAE